MEVRFSGFFWLKLLFLLTILSIGMAMETNLYVDCHSEPDSIVVRVETDIAFQGLVYVSGHFGDPKCTTRGKGATSTVFNVPFLGCNTTEKKKGLFMNKVVVQQHPLIVSSGDGEYEVGCQMFDGDLLVNSDGSNALQVGGLNSKKIPTSVSEPDVLLRIYDFENDVFVDKVRLGQVVELEVTIRDGRVYQGRLEECDASNDNGTIFPVIRNFCPVDLSVSDKVYVDDQSRTTGDYYLYIPFKMFRFLEGSRVSFTCKVIVCKHQCPSADCGDYQGMSYGRRKKRSATSENQELTVTNAVDVVDSDHRVPRAKGQGIVLEENTLPSLPTRTLPEQPNETGAMPSKLFSMPMEYLVAGAAVLFGLIVSVSINLYLLVIVRKRLRKATNSDSSDGGSGGDNNSLSDVRTPFFATSGSRRYDWLNETPMQHRIDLVRGSRWDDTPYRKEADWKYPRYESYPEFYSMHSQWMGKMDNREIYYPPMPIRQAQSTRRSHSFRY